MIFNVIIYIDIFISCNKLNGICAVQSQVQLFVFSYPQLIGINKIKSRIADMKKFDLNIRISPIRKNSKEEKSSEISSRIKRKNERDPIKRLTIKTLAGARWNEMKKVKDELKAMLPILKPSEVKRFNFIF